MRALVLGAGLQGSACTYDLLHQEDVEGVTLADLDLEHAADFVPENSRLTRVRLDFTDEEAVREAMMSQDVVLSAAPYYFNEALARWALESGCHFSDLGGNTAVLRRQLEMNDLARERGVTALPDVGLAPGMVNALAAEGIRRLDRADSIRMYVGGLPQNPVPPLNYQVAYSLEGMLDYYTTRCWILRDGEPTRIDALTELEELDFDDVGRLEAFHTAGGTSLMPWDFAGDVGRIEYKTMRYPGHAGIMSAVRDLGLLSQEPIAVGEREVVPRDVFIAAVTPHLSRPDRPSLVALRMIAEGERGGEPTRLVWDLVDYDDPETGISSMERTTGFTLSITGLFLGRGVIGDPGVFPSYAKIPYEPYVAELAARGIEIRYMEE